MKYKGATPCNNCPYRKDAPLQFWNKAEFKKLLEAERDQFGTVYGCHNNDGTVCRGWLMNQDARRHPSIALRLSLIRHNVTRQYLDKLHCRTPMYRSVREMAAANYPELANYGLATDCTCRRPLDVGLGYCLNCEGIINNKNKNHENKP